MKIILITNRNFSPMCAFILAILMGMATLALLKTGSLFSSFLLNLELGKIEGLRLDLTLILDIYSLSFIARVFLISSCVIIFSSSYILAEKFNLRFHLLVLRFVTAIGLLILRPNLISVLLG